MSQFIPLIRYDKYKNFFNINDGDIASLYGVYNWYRFVASQLFSFIGDFEIILRSNIHANLSKFYFKNESDFWFIDISVITSIQREVAKHKRLNPKNLIAIKKNITFTSMFSLSKKSQSMVIESVATCLKDNNNVTINKADDIVSKLSFGFWVNILQEISTNPNKPNFQNLLQTFFPNNSNIYDQDFYNQNLKLLFRVKALRNRISHQENFLRTPEPNFPHQDFIPRTPSQSIKSLNILLQDMIEFVELLDNSYKSEVEKLQSKIILNTLLDLNTIELFRKQDASISVFMPIFINFLNTNYNLKLKMLI